MAVGRKSKSHLLGNVSLGVMVGGMAVMEGLLHFQVLAHPAWRLLATGFEAGTIGGIADWYAVRAMFHHVPLPLLSRHSNILLRNRQRITDAIVDAVQNKWLSAQAIGAFLAGQSPSKLVLGYLSDPAHQRLLLSGVRKATAGAVQKMDTGQLEAFIEQALRDQLQSLPLAQPLGRWLLEMIAQRKHDALWESLLTTLEKSLSQPGSEAMLAATMKRTASRYAHMGLMKGLGKRVLEAAGMIDYDAMARATMLEAGQFIARARHDAKHPLRVKLDESLQQWAAQLAAGDGPAVAVVNEWRDRLVQQATLGPLIGQMLTRLRQTLLTQLASGEAPLSQMIQQWLAQQLEQLECDHDRQARVDAWVRRRVPDVVARYSHVIGDVVRGKLAAADDAQWVRDIEQNVGDDLQYIRLNGAIVGFGVGVVLAGVRLLTMLLLG